MQNHRQNDIEKYRETRYYTGAIRDIQNHNRNDIEKYRETRYYTGVKCYRQNQGRNDIEKYRETRRREARYNAKLSYAKLKYDTQIYKRRESRYYAKPKRNK